MNSLFNTKKMRLLKESVFILIILFLGHTQIFPQERYYVHYLANNPQLPSNLIKSIEKDKEGYIWIASDGGLIRYDGETIQTYNSAFGSKYIKNLYKYNDTVFVIADEGIYKITKQANQYSVFPYIKGATTKTDSLVFYPKGMFVDRNDNVWISEPNSILKLKTGKMKRYDFPAKDNTQSYLRSFLFAEDNKGNLIATSQPGGLYYYNTERDSFISININNKFSGSFDALCVSGNHEILAGGGSGLFALSIDAEYASAVLTRVSEIRNVSSIARNDDGGYFVGTWNSGLYKFKSLNEAPVKVSELYFNSIVDVYICNEGTIWISSDEGLAFLNKKYFGRALLSPDSYYIENVIKTKGNKILASEGRGVFEIFNNAGKLKIDRIFTASESIIRSIGGEPDNLWIGFSDGFVVNYKNGVSKKYALIQKESGQNVVGAICSDKNGYTWAIEEIFDGIIRINGDHPIKYYDAAKGLNSHLTVVKESPDGELYCAGTGNKNYLYKYIPSTDSFINISAPLLFDQASPLEINDIDFDSSGNIWLASASGLLKYSNNKLERINNINISSSGVIKSVAVDSKKNVWMGMEFGLAVFRNDGYSMLYDIEDGLPNMTMTFRTAAVDQDNRVWSGTARGLTFLLDEFGESIKTPAPVFTSIVSGNKIINGSELNELDYRASLSLKFNSLTYPASEVYYQYRIKNIDSNWTEPGQKNDLFIHQLDAGDYLIEVRAIKTGNIWSDVSSMSFSVNKPLYLTIYAFILYALLLLGLIIIIIVFYKEKIERKKLSDQLSHLFRTSSDIFIVYSSEGGGKLLYVNPAGQAFLGLSNSSPWDSFIKLFSPNEQSVMEEKLYELKQTRSNISFAAGIPNQRGKEFVYQWNISASSKFDRYYLVGRDITDIKNLENRMADYIEELQLMNDDIKMQSEEMKKLNEKLLLSEKSLMEINANKDRFFSIISHDLKNPFFAIIGYSDILLSDVDSMPLDEIKESVEAIHSSSRSVAKLLEELLDWARIQMGQFEFIPEKINVSSLCRGTAELLEASAQNKSITFQLDLPDELNVYADKKSVQLLIRNLLSNAIKFSHENSKIIVRAKRTNGKISIDIIDEGIGISELNLQKLFRIDVHHSTKGTRNEMGTGLGLILCKEFAEGNGGNIFVESKLGEGSKFTITLPAKD